MGDGMCVGVIINKVVISLHQPDRKGSHNQRWSSNLRSLLEYD